MKMTLLSTHGVGGHGKFDNTKNYTSDGEDLNTLVIYFCIQVTKTSKNSKGKPKHDLDLDAESKHFNLKNTDIIEEYDSE